MGTHFCSQGAVKRVTQHRVLMQFHLREGYRITFLEEDCRTHLPLKLSFITADKIIEMLERWGEDRTTTARSKLEADIKIGRPGGVWLLLTPEQYAKLKR